MTLPAERSRSVENTRKFLLDLIDPKKTPRIPRKIRLRARSLLKHYPWGFYINVSSKKLPDIWGLLDE